MSRIIFIFVLSSITLIRVPLSFLIVVLKLCFPFLEKRIAFERKNLIEIECRSFKKDGLVADFCFEVSSEGEMEQIRPILEYFLRNKKRIEILFASASVEKKCIELAREHSLLIRLMRLPIASFMPVDFLFFQSPWSWVTAPNIIFCRYDFYPELLLFKYFSKKLILVSAANKKPSWFKEQAYGLFDLIVAANIREERFFKSLFPYKKIYNFDFRVPRIFDRGLNSSSSLSGIFEIQDYLSFLKQRPEGSKVILGSIWPSDLIILENKNWEDDLVNGRLHILIVPHSLTVNSIKEVLNKLKTLFPKLPIYEISTSQKGPNLFDLLNFPGIVVLNRAGILCEFYTQFSFAYVGGGYERSIHSVLEPYLCQLQVACGPLVHRSTEYDLIKELSPQEIHLLKNAESFYNLFIEMAKNTPDSLIRISLKNRSLALMETIINEIELC